MTTTVEQAILEYARGRLLCNRREFRWIAGDGMINVGRLARAVNLGQMPVLERRFSPAMVDAAVAVVTPLNQSDEVGAFAPLTLEAPCLGYLKADGSEVLIDGLKRARQRFASGRPDVTVKLIGLDDARRFGLSPENRKRWKGLDLTEHHLVGARSKHDFDKFIVEFWDDREADKPRRGQPTFSVQQNKLADSVNLYLIALIEVEFFIYRHYPKQSLIAKIKQTLDRSSWIEAFVRALNQTGRLPVAQSPSEVANLARRSIASMTDLRSRPEFKKALNKAWAKMSPSDLVQERDATLDLCAATMKADLRFRLRQSSTRTLVGWENNVAKEVGWRQIQSTFEGRDDERRRLYEISKLGFEEQLMVTQVTGINMNDVYYDHGNRDPLFQAHTFLFGIGRHRRAMNYPCMTETIIHRRALDISGQRDRLTQSWEGFFENWDSRHLDDTLLLQMARQLDEGQFLDDENIPGQ